MVPYYLNQTLGKYFLYVFMSTRLPTERSAFFSRCRYACLFLKHNLDPFSSNTSPWIHHLTAGFIAIIFP